MINKVLIQFNKIKIKLIKQIIDKLYKIIFFELDYVSDLINIIFLFYYRFLIFKYVLLF